MALTVFHASIAGCMIPPHRLAGLLGVMLGAVKLNWRAWRREKADQGATPWTTEQVLQCEAREIRNADVKESGSALYRRLNSLDLSALCLSGGGIRSAAFALGVVQGLASCRRPTINGDGPADADDDTPLLGQFDYLSTVSGGGYIGGWLSALRKSHSDRQIFTSLAARSSNDKSEPSELKWLRSYSNYLTPKTGLTSSDTWTALALTLRNLLLNWLVILCPICALIVFLKLIGLWSWWIIDWVDPRFGLRQGAAWTWPFRFKLLLEIFAGIAGIAFSVVAMAKITRSRPGLRAPKSYGPTEIQFLMGPMLWSVASAIFLVHFIASDLAGNLLLKCKSFGSTPTADLGLCAGHDWLNEAAKPIIYYVGGGALFGALSYLAAWLTAKPREESHLNWPMLAAGATHGSLIAIALYAYLVIPDVGIAGIPVDFFHLVFGVPYLLVAAFVAECIFVGLSGHKLSDADREWLGRSSGWFLCVAALWLVAFYLVFFGTRLADAVSTDYWESLIKAALPILAAGSGLITATVAKSSQLPASGQSKGMLSWLGALLLPVTSAVFAAAVIVIASYTIDLVIFGRSLEQVVQAIQSSYTSMQSAIFKSVAYYQLWEACVAFAILSVILSRCININWFSLHSIYRNRLVRAFLGAARDRNPDKFDGFDFEDDFPVRTLWPPAAGGKWRPFHIINITLNLVSAKQLAWQERKAAPFTVSPRHSGSSELGYRDSCEYGGGITLGTAIAISGAAASPNMGYYSSPSVTFLMSMLNVRLGWWLGNPGRTGGSSYRKDGPRWAILMLLAEAFGLTTSDRNYVYLSDGGHFDNLGLYEMVRRRCRSIVVSDASCDPDFSFSELGNALRKISIDFGIQIRFKNLNRLTNRPGEPTDRPPYHAIGQIDYGAVDGGGSEGYVLYIKPAAHGIRDVAVRAYAADNPKFPHQPSLNQWFTESQFESYRALGFEIVERVLSGALNEHPGDEPRLQNILKTLYARATEWEQGRIEALIQREFPSSWA